MDIVQVIMVVSIFQNFKILSETFMFVCLFKIKFKNLSKHDSTAVVKNISSKIQTTTTLIQIPLSKSSLRNLLPKI